MKSISRKLSFLLLVLLIAVIAGCSGGEEVSGGNDTDSSQSSNSGSDNGEDVKVIELSLMHSWVEDRPEHKVFRNRIASFNEEHSGIKVNFQGVPADQFRVKMKTLAAGKQLPDMFKLFPGAELEPYVEAGLVAPIDDYMDNWKDLIPQNKLKYYQVDGKQYGLPSTISLTNLVYYDKDQLAEVGYDKFPETYADFKDLVKKLRGNGLVPISLGNKAPWVLQSVYLSTIGDRVTGSDFLPNVLRGEQKFTDQEFIDAVAVIDELNKMKAFNDDKNTIDVIQSRDYFTQGKAAMIIEGSWALGSIVEKMPDGKNVGISVFPTIEDGDGTPGAVSGVATSAFGMNNELSGKKKDAAVTFMKYFFSEQLYKNLAKAESIIAGDVELSDDLHPLYKEVVKAAKGDLAPVYDATISPRLAELINNELQSLTIGKTTPKKIAQKMQKELEDEKE